MIAVMESTSDLVWGRSDDGTSDRLHRPLIWTEVCAWLALLPTLFITVSGRIQADSGPVAFRFTAMEEDSLSRRLARLGCSILILLLISTRFRAILKICKQAKLLFLLPGVAFVSTVWSQNPSHTLVDASNLMLTSLFAVYLYLRYPGERIISFLTFTASISLLLSMLAVILFPSVGIDAFQQNSWRGIFGQRNNCAAVCTFFLVLGLHYRARAFAEHLMRGAVLLLSIIFIVMSGSRTGWLLAALGVALTYGIRFVGRMRSLDRLGAFLVLVIPAVLLCAFVANNFNQILALMDKDPTMTQRTVIWAQVLPSIAKQPLHGYGYSSFWMGLNGESMQAVLTTGWMEGQAQDGYLDVLLQLGLIGLVPLVWTFVRAFGQAIAAMEHRIGSAIIRLAIVFLPLMLVENIGESSFLLPLGIPWFYTSISLLTLSFWRTHLEAV